MRMAKQTQDAEMQHLLLMVDSAQRAGLSEAQIGVVVDDARETDTELDRAA
jgi:hypothetical protein